MGEIRNILLELSNTPGIYGLSCKMIIDDYNEDEALLAIREVREQIDQSKKECVKTFGQELVNKIIIYFD